MLKMFKKLKKKLDLFTQIPNSHGNEIGEKTY